MGTSYDHTWQAIRPSILERDGHVCRIAGPRCKTAATEVDHIVPLSEGGARLDPDNLRAACKTCNAGRQNRRIAELAKALQRPLTPPAASRDW